MANEIRINKYIADSGLCSRRAADKLIESGRVRLNGETLKTPAVKVGTEDEVLVDGQPVKPVETTVLYRFYKPRGVLCTAKDPQGRPTIFDLLPPGAPRLVLVGRLDMNSEGLLLLTNDGDLAQKMMQPKTGLERTYRVRAYGKIPPNFLSRLSKGIKIDGVKYRPIKVEVDKNPDGHNTWFNVTLQEGKNREIRKVFEHFGLQVSRLIRTGYGPFGLTNLPPKGIVEVPQHTMKKFLSKLEEVK